jgi:hypothetical protein
VVSYDRQQGKEKEREKREGKKKEKKLKKKNCTHSKQCE